MALVTKGGHLVSKGGHLATSCDCCVTCPTYSITGTYVADLSGVEEEHCHENCTQDFLPSAVTLTAGTVGPYDWTGYAVDPVSGQPCAYVTLSIVCITDASNIDTTCGTAPALPYLQWGLGVQFFGNPDLCPGGPGGVGFCKNGGTTPAGNYSDGTLTVTIS